MVKRRLKDVDATERLHRARIFVYALVAGPIFGAVAGFSVGRAVGVDPFVAAAIGIPVGVALVYYTARAVVGGAAASMEKIYNPSGETTPRAREYSYAASLVARGRLEEAAEAYELHAIEYPEDPEPYFQLARLCRDQLNRPQDAITWFRRARADAELTRGQELLAVQEIIDVYIHRLETPRKAIPELVLLCERFPDTPAAETARRELGEMRDILVREHEGLGTFTTQFLKKVDRGRLSAAAGLTREELERQVIGEALEECGGDRKRAAERLGVSLAKLEETMRELGI